MVLNSDDIELLKFKQNDVVVKKVNLSIGEYYAKYCSVYSAFRELLGKKIFDLVGIKCPEYSYIRETSCVISEDINKYDTYYNPFDLDMNGYTLSNIKSKLLGKFDNTDELYLQIDIMHFIDILFSNIDRHVSNYGFSKREDGMGYLVVYDNADFLQEFKKATRPMSIREADGLTFVFTSKQEEASVFIQNMSEEQRKYFYKIYEMFSPIRLFTIIRSIEKENNIKLPDKFNVLKLYALNYYMVGSLLKEKDKIKKKN